MCPVYTQDWMAEREGLIRRAGARLTPSGRCRFAATSKSALRICRTEGALPHPHAPTKMGPVGPHFCWLNREILKLSRESSHRIRECSYKYRINKESIRYIEMQRPSPPDQSAQSHPRSASCARHAAALLRR